MAIKSYNHEMFKCYQGGYGYVLRVDLGGWSECVIPVSAGMTVVALL